MTAPKPTRHLVLDDSLLHAARMSPGLCLVQEIVSMAPEVRIWYTSELLHELRSRRRLGSLTAANELERLLPGGLVTSLSVPGFPSGDRPSRDVTERHSAATLATARAATAVADAFGEPVHIACKFSRYDDGRPRFDVPQDIARVHGVGDRGEPDFEGLRQLATALGIDPNALARQASVRFIRALPRNFKLKAEPRIDALVRDVAREAHQQTHSGGDTDPYQFISRELRSSRLDYVVEAQVGENSMAPAPQPVELLVDMAEVPNELGSLLMAIGSEKGQWLSITLTARSGGEVGTAFERFTSPYPEVNQDITVAVDDVLTPRGATGRLRMVITDQPLSQDAVRRCNDAGFSIRDDLDDVVASLLEQDPSNVGAVVSRAAAAAGPVRSDSYLRRLREIAPATSAVITNANADMGSEVTPFDDFALSVEPHPLMIVVPDRKLLPRSDLNSPLRLFLDTVEDLGLISLEWPAEEKDPDEKYEIAAYRKATTRAAAGPHGPYGPRIEVRYLHSHMLPSYYLESPIFQFDDVAYSNLRPRRLVEHLLSHRPERTRNALRTAFLRYGSSTPKQARKESELAAEFVNAIVGESMELIEFPEAETLKEKVEVQAYKLRYILELRSIRNEELRAFDDLRGDVYIACLGREQPDPGVPDDLTDQTIPDEPSGSIIKLNDEDRRVLFGDPRKGPATVDTQRLNRFLDPPLAGDESPQPLSQGEPWDGRPTSAPSGFTRDRTAARTTETSPTSTRRSRTKRRK